MAEFSTVARPYAEALFDAACDDKAFGTQAWLDLINELAQIASNADVRQAMSEPRLTNAQRAQVFSSVAKSKLPPSATNFIQLLADNNRLMLLPEIARQFAALKNSSEGSAQVDITTAFELSEAQVADLVAALERKFGLKLKPNVTIDPSLIGGVRVAVGDKVLDTSVQAQLASMRDTLAA
jgi:F-type H+-transporting ATPase subunit delta